MRNEMKMRRVCNVGITTGIWGVARGTVTVDVGHDNDMVMMYGYFFDEENAQLYFPNNGFKKTYGNLSRNELHQLIEEIMEEHLG